MLRYRKSASAASISSTSSRSRRGGGRGKGGRNVQEDNTPIISKSKVLSDGEPVDTTKKKKGLFGLVKSISQKVSGNSSNKSVNNQTKKKKSQRSSKPHTMKVSTSLSTTLQSVPSNSKLIAITEEEYSQVSTPSTACVSPAYPTAPKVSLAILCDDNGSPVGKAFASNNHHRHQLLLTASSEEESDNNISNDTECMGRDDRDTVSANRYPTLAAAAAKDKTPPRRYYSDHSQNYYLQLHYQGPVDLDLSLPDAAVQVRGGGPVDLDQTLSPDNSFADVGSGSGAILPTMTVIPILDDNPLLPPLVVDDKDNDDTVRLLPDPTMTPPATTTAHNNKTSPNNRIGSTWGTNDFLTSSFDPEWHTDDADEGHSPSWISRLATDANSKDNPFTPMKSPPSSSDNDIDWNMNSQERKPSNTPFVTPSCDIEKGNVTSPLGATPAGTSHHYSPMMADENSDFSSSSHSTRDILLRHCHTDTALLRSSTHTTTTATGNGIPVLDSPATTTSSSSPPPPPSSLLATNGTILATSSTSTPPQRKRLLVKHLSISDVNPHQRPSETKGAEHMYLSLLHQRTRLLEKDLILPSYDHDDDDGSIGSDSELLNRLMASDDEEDDEEAELLNQLMRSDDEQDNEEAELLQDNEEAELLALAGSLNQLMRSDDEQDNEEAELFALAGSLNQLMQSDDEQYDEEAELLALAGRHMVENLTTVVVPTEHVQEHPHILPEEENQGYTSSIPLEHRLKEKHRASFIGDDIGSVPEKTSPNISFLGESLQHILMDNPSSPRIETTSKSGESTYSIFANGEAESHNEGVSVVKCAAGKTESPTLERQRLAKKHLHRRGISNSSSDSDYSSRSKSSVTSLTDSPTLKKKREQVREQQEYLRFMISQAKSNHSDSSYSSSPNTSFGSQTEESGDSMKSMTTVEEEENEDSSVHHQWVKFGQELKTSPSAEENEYIYNTSFSQCDASILSDPPTDQLETHSAEKSQHSSLVSGDPPGDSFCKDPNYKEDADGFYGSDDVLTPLASDNARESGDESSSCSSRDSEAERQSDGAFPVATYAPRESQLDHFSSSSDKEDNSETTPIPSSPPTNSPENKDASASCAFTSDPQTPLFDSDCSHENHPADNTSSSPSCDKDSSAHIEPQDLFGVDTQESGLIGPDNTASKTESRKKQQPNLACSLSCGDEDGVEPQPSPDQPLASLPHSDERLEAMEGFKMQFASVSRCHFQNSSMTRVPSDVSNVLAPPKTLQIDSHFMNNPNPKVLNTTSGTACSSSHTANSTLLAVSTKSVTSSNKGDIDISGSYILEPEDTSRSTGDAVETSGESEDSYSRLPLLRSAKHPWRKPTRKPKKLKVLSDENLSESVDTSVSFVSLDSSQNNDATSPQSIDSSGSKSPSKPSLSASFNLLESDDESSGVFQSSLFPADSSDSFIEAPLLENASFNNISAIEYGEEQPLMHMDTANHSFLSQEEPTANQGLPEESKRNGDIYVGKSLFDSMGSSREDLGISDDDGSSAELLDNNIKGSRENAAKTATPKVPLLDTGTRKDSLKQYESKPARQPVVVETDKPARQPVVVETVNSDGDSLEESAEEIPTPSPPSVQKPSPGVAHKEVPRSATWTAHSAQKGRRKFTKGPASSANDSIDVTLGDILDMVTDNFSPWGLPNFFTEDNLLWNSPDQIRKAAAAAAGTGSKNIVTKDAALVEMTSVECTLEEPPRDEDARGIARQSPERETKADDLNEQSPSGVNQFADV